MTMQHTWIADDWTFLMGAVWESSGDELHTNRLANRSGTFAGRILSGITSCVRSIYEVAPDHLYSDCIQMNWSFDAPIYEGEEVRVDHSDNEPNTFALTTAERACGQGAVHPSEPDAATTRSPEPGLRVSGRTFTEADTRLFSRWLPSDQADESTIPWPVLLFTASRQVASWGGIPHSMLLNRALHWRVRRAVDAGETLETYITAASERRSVSSPEFRVITLSVQLVATERADAVADFSWVVLAQ